jgi:hypothetical protein
MKQKSFALCSAIALVIGSLAGTAYGWGEPVKGKPVTEQEAAKKYPKPKGGYPTATLGTQGSTFVPSPYNSGRMIDTSDCKRGELCLDPMANKVFIKP